MSARAGDVDAATLVAAAVTVAVVYVSFRLWQFRFGRQVVDVVARKLEEENDAAIAAEEPQARYRLTAGRLAKATPGNGTFDAIIIGSGPAGLGCAAALARLGWRCCVLEQGEQLGGGAHVFSEAGYEFETGVHYLGRDTGMQDMLDFLTCGRLQMSTIGTPVTVRDGHIVSGGTASAPSAATAAGSGKDGAAGTTGVMYDCIRVAGQDYPFVAGRANLEAMLKARFTGADDLARIDRFLERLDFMGSDSYATSAQMFFRLKVPSFLRGTHGFIAALRSFLQTRLLGRHYFRATQVTSEEFLRELDIDPDSRLGAVLLGQYGDAGMRPDKCSAMMHMGVMCHYLHGSVYPVGGSGAIPRKLNAVVLAGGGRSFVQARVEGLLARPNGSCGGVRVNGMDVRARFTISSTGALRTYSDLIAPIPAHAPAARAAVSRIKATSELSCAFIFLFIGLDVSDAPDDVKTDSRAHNTWIYPQVGYTAMEKDIEAAEPWSRPMPMFVASGSAKDTAWATKHGDAKKTIVVLSQCPWSWVKPWAGMTHEQRKGDTAYGAFKAKAQAAMMEQGFRVVFPKHEPFIRHAEVGTPLSTNTFLATEQGECYGRSATPSRWLCPDLSPYTPMNDLYMTGQDIVTLGVSGSVASGYLTANVVAGYGGWENAVLSREIRADLGMKPLF